MTIRPKPRWGYPLPRIAVAVAPLRNLTGDPDRQYLLDAFTDDLVTDLLHGGSGLSFVRVVTERGRPSSLPRAVEPEIDCMITGSVERVRAGMLGLDLQIKDASIGHGWMSRYEFVPEELASIQIEITRRISRDLHVLLLQAACRRSLGDVGPEVDECLSRAATALKGEVRSEPSAEAQQWFLAALARDPRNVEALTGLAQTCQLLVSQPWWGESRAVAFAFDLGREALEMASEFAPGDAAAIKVRGMLYSAAGQLEEASAAFAQALTMAPQLASAHAFAGYNSAFLGRAEDTLPAVEQAMRHDQSDRRHSIFFFFAGFAQLLLGKTEAATALLQKSLERNPSYGAAELFLAAALHLLGRNSEAARAAAGFREQYPESRMIHLEKLWLARSANPVYRAQINPIFDRIRALGIGG
jgi:tetratricopeptide (TPR) repeat protein